MANYSIISETYDETLDLGYEATNSFSPLFRAGRQGQLHHPRTPSLQVDRQSTSVISPPPRFSNSPSGRIQHGGNNQGVVNGPSYIPFLKKKQKRNVILDDSEEEIPFSAIRDMYKYEAFVTNIHPDADLNEIKGHIARKLDINDIYIKPMSRTGAPYLSFGLFCKSQRGDLNLKMRGLWPKYTKIYKWNSKAGDTGASNRNTSSNIRQNLRENQGPHLISNQQNTSDRYRLPSAEQRRLHSQHV